MALNGSVSIAQQDYLRIICAGLRNVAEIGFNEGVSAGAMLSANPYIRVTSFELADHDDMHAGKLRTDLMFPGRHGLVQGDSGVTVPEAIAEMGERCLPGFDLMFVDGDHEAAAVAVDLWNSLKAVRPGGLIVVDDLTPWKPWGKGPAAAWGNLLATGAVAQIDLRLDGERIMTVPGDGAADARVWATGMVM